MAKSGNTAVVAQVVGYQLLPKTATGRPVRVRLKVAQTVCGKLLTGAIVVHCDKDALNRDYPFGEGVNVALAVSQTEIDFDADPDEESDEDGNGEDTPARARRRGGRGAPAAAN